MRFSPIRAFRSEVEVSRIDSVSVVGVSRVRSLRPAPRVGRGGVTCTAPVAGLDSAGSSATRSQVDDVPVAASSVIRTTRRRAALATSQNDRGGGSGSRWQRRQRGGRLTRLGDSVPED